MGVMLALGGFLIVSGAMVQYFMTIAKEEVPEDVRLHAALFGGGAVVAALGAALAPGALTIVLAAFAVMLGGFLVWLLGQRRTPDGSLIARVGEVLPELVAPDQDGARVDLAARRGERLLLKFFRGSW